MSHPLSGLLSKVSSIRNKRAALKVKAQLRHVPKAQLDRELDRLISETMDIQGIAEWAADQRGESYRDAVADEVTKLMVRLPDAVLEDVPTAQVLAAMIKSYANALRIFNSPVLEYERVRELVDKRLASIGDTDA